MKNKLYCYQSVVTPGSPFYYALKKIPLAKRDAVVAMVAFYHEIEKVIFKGADPLVTQRQLHWFRQDIFKIASGCPEHPVSLFLQQVHPLPVKQYLDLIDGLEQNLNPTAFLSFEEVVIHVMRTAGLRDVLIANHLLSNEHIDLDIVYQFSLVTEWVHYLQMIRSYLRIGKICFAMPEMQHCQVTANEFYQYQTTPAIDMLFKAQADKVKAAYANLSSMLNDGQREKCHYFLLRAKMANALLDVIANEQYKVLEKFIQLTPIRLWWLSIR